MSANDLIHNSSSEIYMAYSADVEERGWADFTHEANARAFASTYAAETGIALDVSRNRDSRWIVRAPGS